MNRILTLGAPLITCNGQEQRDLTKHRQKLAIVTFVALEGPVTRDRVTAVFWPDSDEAKARHALSQAIYVLNNEFGLQIAANGDYLEVDPASIQVDAVGLSRAAAENRWDEVVNLYRAHFLDGFSLPRCDEFERWQAHTRAWLARQARRAFQHVVDEKSTSGDIQGALDVAWRWASLEPLEDEAQHALIALLARAGDRSAALKRFEDYKQRLADELEVEPLEETLSLVEKIRAGAAPDIELDDRRAASAAARTSSVGWKEWRDRTPAAIAIADEAPVLEPKLHATLEERVRAELAPTYEVVKQLAQGSTSEVYLMREARLNRYLVFKVFAPHLSKDPRTLRRFQREARAVAHLSSHPNIATLHWVGSLGNGIPYIVMEYVKGRTLKRRLKAEGTLPVDDACGVLADISSALAAAHAGGIVHRDLRPSNVLCDDESGRAYLTDFGLSAFLARADTDPSSRITQSGELIGDPAYMSPEQVQGHRASEQSDIFPLGLIGYRLLCEENPYNGDSAQALCRAHVEDDPRPLKALCADVDDELCRLLQSCLARNPEERPTASFVTAKLNYRSH